LIIGEKKQKKRDENILYLLAFIKTFLADIFLLFHSIAQVLINNIVLQQQDFRATLKQYLL